MGTAKAPLAPSTDNVSKATFIVQFENRATCSIGKPPPPVVSDSERYREVRGVDNPTLVCPREPSARFKGVRRRQVTYVSAGWREIQPGASGAPKQPGWQQKIRRRLRDQGLVLRQLEEKLGTIQN